MASRPTTMKQETVETVISTMRGRVSERKAEAAETFIRHYYDDVAPEDILGADPEDLYGAALSLWQFGARRRPGEAAIRVYNPRVEQHGWHSPHTVVEIVNDDMPFLVDSVTMALNRLGLTVHLVVHPQFRVERDGEGRIAALGIPGADSGEGFPESFMHVEIDEQGTADRLRAIETEMADTLADVRAAVAAWQPMQERAAALVDELKRDPPRGVEQEEVNETVAFLRWLLDDHFTFLGYREMEIEGEGGAARIRVLGDSCLGLLRDPDIAVFQGLRRLGRLPAEVQAYLREPHVLVMAKSNRRSTVHRPVHMDAIAVKRFDHDGNVTGVRLFVGLFTSAAYNQTPREIPILRRKVSSLMARAGYGERSHAGKALIHILDNFPRDELFQI
ncbi:MAG TPA: NAD-glutamate dehydrogenase, partial [Alphaproteobacteria bacterium]|nr:NAD-glutamate dehydrogenase [Alphaproteobacteria bacterium]